MPQATPPADLAQIRPEFERDGYIAIQPLFDAAKMAEINRELDRFIADCVPHMPDTHVFYENKTDRTTIKQMQNMADHDGYFRDLFETDIIREIAAAALNEVVRPVNLEFFNKPPGIGQATPPHQDGYYFHLDAPKAVTGWLALEDVDDENGCIHYVRGSHRAAGYRDHGRTGVLGFSQGITDFGTAADRAGEVAFAGPAGTFLMHDCRTVHWAGANRSATRSRRALGFVYFASSARVDAGARAAYQARLQRDMRAADQI
jgi:2-oxoglutarate-dependent dioxygenase